MTVKVHIELVGGYAIDYKSNDPEEELKIRYFLEEGKSLEIVRGGRTTYVNLNNILVVDIKEVEYDSKI